MILEALGRLRRTSRSMRNPYDNTDDERFSSAFSENQDGGSRMSTAPSLAGAQSVRSNATATTTSSALHGAPSITSLTSTKGSQAGRRMSNNLFGSGKFNDHTYVRSVHQRRGPTSPSSLRTNAAKHAESNTSMSTVTSSRIAAGNSTSMYSDSQSLRPVTPDGSAYASSVPSSPNQPSFTKEINSTEGLPGILPPEVLGRASLALDEVIRELEEEGDDEIVMERSPISSVSSPIHTTATSSMGYAGSMARPPVSQHQHAPIFLTLIERANADAVMHTFCSPTRPQSPRPLRPPLQSTNLILAWPSLRMNQSRQRLILIDPHPPSFPVAQPRRQLSAFQATFLGCPGL